MQGAFQAWHGMQFLFKLVLNHNPLRVIEDSSFYKLPSLKFLDLGSTEITPDILENLLKISLKLKTLILPRKMSCCLCRIQDDIEVLCKTVKLDCINKCASNITQCEKEELLGSMQDEVMKVLETRKLNASSILSIVPEKLLHHNVTLSLLVTHGHSHLGIRFHKHNPSLFKSASQLSKLIPDEYVDVKWNDKNELEKLYKLANLLQVALKAKLAENEEETQETEVQKELPIEVSEDSGDIILRTKSHLKRVKRNLWLGKNPRGKESFLRLRRKRQEFAKSTRQLAGEQGKLASGIMAERWRKLARGLNPQRVASLSRLHRAALHSLHKRSIFHLPTKLPPLTASIVVDESAEDLAGKVVIILKAANRSSKPSHVKDILISEEEKEADTQNGQDAEKGLEPQVSSKENLLNHLIIGGGKSRIPTDDSETLNELSPDITLSHETHWEHHEQTTSAPPSLDFLPATDDYLLQGDLFEAELNRRLASLIPNEPVRNLISHVIRILKMDCTEPTIQMACAKLISRTGLLMKLFSERENIQEASALWKSYFWPATNEANMTTPSSRKMQKPSDEIARQGIPQYGYGNKLLLAISVTAVIMVIIAVICLIEICSQRSAKGREGTPQERRTFLGRKKKGTPEKQTSASSFDKPLWLKDMYQPLDEIRKKDMIDKLHDEESSEEEDIFNWASARPPEVPEPLPVETL
ncbi:leucine-rich repeat-containing protein 37A2-like [Candoia aspera]|uniref:leucine-rich repeat-containing protein 37A2-like n=1 Tax=Candoia aspera TaxID=51853 RepID=UPI002FD7BA2F